MLHYTELSVCKTENSRQQNRVADSREDKHTHTHIVQQFVEVLLQLVEVDRGDEVISGFVQAVSGQLDDLVVDEAQDPISQREHAVRRERVDKVC